MAHFLNKSDPDMHKVNPKLFSQKVLLVTHAVFLTEFVYALKAKFLKIKPPNFKLEDKYYVAKNCSIWKFKITMCNKKFTLDIIEENGL